MMSVGPMGRRRFLHTAVATAGAGVLAACGKDAPAAGPGAADISSQPPSGEPSSGRPTSGGSTGAAPAKSLLPSYTASSQVTPDLPATELIPPAFLHYPSNPVAVRSGAPGKGGSVSSLLIATRGLPPAKDKNPFWQALDKKLGVSLGINYTTSQAYSSKAQTILAGGDSPDFMEFSTSIPNLSGVLAAQFTDLAEFLSGDGINDYPALAAIPTYAWKNVAIGGGLYGVPYALPPISDFIFARADILQSKGLSAGDLKTGKDFIDICRALTDVKHNKWAIGVWGTAVAAVQQMVGVPNTWRVAEGKFTSQYETDEYKQSLDIVAGLWKQGVMSPDAFSSTANFKQQFGGGSCALVYDGWAAWSSYLQTYKSASPDIALTGLVLPKWDGGGQSGAYLGSGMYTFTALKKTKDRGRTRALLSILDWLASPFGSQEYLFCRYGVAPRDYTLQGSDPVPTDVGAVEVGQMVLSLLATGPQVIYNPGQDQATRDLYDVQKRLSAVTVPYPTAGIFSATNLTKGAAINKKMTDLQLDIVQGRKSLSAWDGGVKAWREGGGDQIRSEYEKAYAAAHN